MTAGSQRSPLPSLLFIALLGLCHAAFAQGPAPPPMQAVALQPGEHIVLDGTLTAPAWQRAPVFSGFIEREPRNGAKPRYETRVRVLTGERALYVGVEALDPEPALIRAPLVRHDGVVRTQDFIALYLDPIGRGKVAQWFRVNAAGSTADGVHTGDDDNEDFSPDFDFDAAAARNPQGYTAVFRIPYATLRAASGERAPWRIMVVRRVPRSNNVMEASVPLPPDLPSFIANMQPLLGAPSAANAPFFQLRPTLTLRRALDQPAGAPGSADNRLSVGLDLKWRPRAEWVIDATLKPDFSQVELDVPQLSRNTTFALSLTEKRPFFLESSDLLRSPTNALYTRSVTLPAWGVRATLRGEQAAGTLFALRDKGGGLVLLPGPYATGYAEQPAAQVGVARLRRDGMGPDGALTLGGLASLRRYEGAGDNRVAGPDFTWQANDNLKLRGQWLLSQTSAQPDTNGVLAAGPVASASRRYLNAFWRSAHTEAALTYDDIAAGFRDDNGFVVQNGVRTLDANYNRIWRNLGPLNELWLYLWGGAVRDRGNGQLVSSYLTPGAYASYARGSEATVEYRGASHLRVAAGAPLLSERYWHFEYLTTPAPWAPQVSLKLDLGQLADVVAGEVRPGRRLTLGAKLRPLPRLELEPSFSQAQIAQGVQRNYDEVAAQLLAVWHFDAQRSLRLIVQRATLDRRAEPLRAVGALQLGSSASSLTYAWRRSAGTVLYAGASRNSSGFSPLLLRGTELFVKWQFDVDELRGT